MPRAFSTRRANSSGEISRAKKRFRRDVSPAMIPNCDFCSDRPLLSTAIIALFAFPFSGAWVTGYPQYTVFRPRKFRFAWPRHGPGRKKPRHSGGAQLLSTRYPLVQGRADPNDCCPLLRWPLRSHRLIPIDNSFKSTLSGQSPARSSRRRRNVEKSRRARSTPPSTPPDSDAMHIRPWTLTFENGPSFSIRRSHRLGLEAVFFRFARDVYLQQNRHLQRQFAGNAVDCFLITAHYPPIESYVRAAASAESCYVAV